MSPAEGTQPIPTIEELLQLLSLQPHPTEGGYFRETWRAEETVVVRRSESEGGDRSQHLRSVGTAIYYLLTPHSCSTLHRLPTDEIFHFYLGDPVRMLLLYSDGSTQRVTLGTDLLSGQHIQFIVPKGTWFGSYLLKGGLYALMGTTMAPGFDYADYESGSCDKLSLEYPQEAELIHRLTR
jgi:predicted cupin superfamily sugar epimerase